MDYFVKVGDRIEGPFDSVRLKKMLSSREIGPESLCCENGQSKWIPLETVLSSGLASSSPKPQDPFSWKDSIAPFLDKKLRTTVEEFKGLNYEHLIPKEKILDRALWNRKTVRWVLLFGITPIAIWDIASMFNLNFQQTVWMISLYFCGFWALYFNGLIQPARTAWQRGLAYAGFTAFIGIPVLLFMQSFPGIKQLYELTETRSLLGRFIGFTFGVGLLEEFCKAVPLIFFGLKHGTLKDTKDGLFLGFMSGLGFAAAEGVQYTIQATMVAATTGAESDYKLQILQIIFRLMTGPVLHGAWAGTVGWFVGVAANRTEKRGAIIAVGIGFMAFLHGINDVFAGTVLHVLIAAVSVLIFMAYFNHEHSEKLKIAS